MSLSNTQIIALLNRYFVPVYLSNEDYAPGGGASPEEKAQLQRIHREGYAAKLSVGTVHAYILAPDGHLIDSMHTAQVAQPPLLIAMLERNIRALGTKAGALPAKPSPPPAPFCETGSLRLQLTARYLQRKGDDYVLIQGGGGDCSALPSEEGIALRRTEWRRLLPPGAVRIGQSWEFDRNVASALLKHFYPPTENWDLSTNRIDRQSLTANVVSVERGAARAWLAGSLRMKHPFYHRDDDRFVETSLLGLLEFDLDKSRIRSFQMVTDAAVYRGGGSSQPFGVALRSLP